MDVERVEFRDELEVRDRVLAVFNELHASLSRLLPAATIEHIGATSIPGAVTKGDLDVCVLVERGDFDDCDRLLADHYARNVGSDKSPSLSSFVDDSKDVPVGIQLVVRGGQEDFFVRWRELLLRSPDILTRYNDLKRRWHGHSHEDYRTEKSTFIERELGLSQE